MEIGNFSILFILVAAFELVISQNTANLGIFNVRFDIALTNQTQNEASTAAISTSGPATQAMTAVGLTTYVVNIQPLQDTHTITNQLLLKLAAVFSKTTAYLTLTPPEEISDTGSKLTYRYDVIYNKTRLNELSLLKWNSTFIEQLVNATKVITASNMNFTDGFVVDEGATESAMMTSINTLNQAFANDTWLCTGVVCAAAGSGCFVNDTSEIVVCSDKCAQFEAGNSCTKDPSVAGVYVRGTCKVDKNGNPYCDCGKSTGDVMNNFFDGSKCVSVTFIVAMAASAGGFFFLLWLIALCVICSLRGSNNSDSLRKSSTEAFTTYNGYNEAHAGLELNQRTHNADYVSSASNNNAYDVTREGDEELKSVRL